MEKAEYGSRKKFHYLYKTVNKVNGKVYYGMHSTNNLEDSYIGSGKLLRQSIRKYGKENFETTIIGFYDSREELKIAEKDLITEEMLKDQKCYNLQPGGGGGFTPDQARKGRKAADSTLLARYGENFRSIIFKQAYARLTEEERTLRKLQSTERLAKVRPSMLGKKHTQETKEKIGRANSINQKGDRNSQYGRPRSEVTKERIRQGLARARQVDLEEVQKLRDELQKNRNANTVDGRYYNRLYRERVFKVFGISLDGRCREGLMELRNLLEDLYINHKMSTTQLGTRFGVSSEAIRNCLQKFNIPRRNER